MTYSGSRAFAGQGTQLQLGSGTPAAPGSYTTIAEVTKIQRSGSKMDIVDTTNMDSIGAYREKLPTLLDGGDISLDCNYVPQDSTQQSLQTLFDNRTLAPWQIVLPNSLGTWNFNAYVAQVDFDLMTDKASTFTSKLTITGKPVFTPGV
jgi:predicted secreted protein